MRILLLITSLLLVSLSNNAQSYNMANSSDTTCSGTFYDSGGLGLYSSNENFTKTFCSNTAGTTASVNFTSFMTEAGFDFLCIYDGPSTTSPLIGCYSGNGTLNGQTFTSTSGCLTFNFTTDATINLNGWVATLSCKFECQTVIGNIVSTTPLPDTSPLQIIRLCQGGTVNLSGSATFPASGTYYNQSVATSTFSWRTGDGFAINGAVASHTFNMPGTFDVNLISKDTIGCLDTTHAARVIISKAPNFATATYFPNDTICFEDTAIISMSGQYKPFNPPVLQAGDTTFLPDGTGVSYNDTIIVNIFDPAATYQNNFISNLFINMEHSFLGDLEISLICPNNQSVVLKQYPGGGGTHLGEAVDPFITPVPLDPGVGYRYEFTTGKPTYGTMINEAGNYTHTYTDVLSNTYTAQSYLPAGSYTSFQNINTQLNGCPLNGRWIIRITDNLAIDNGYIFKWGFDFDSLIRPPNTVAAILPVMDSTWWTSASFGWLKINDTTIGASPLVPGTHSYTYHLRDNFGCVHDTTLDLFVKNKPKSNAGTDFLTCHLSYQLAPIGTPTASKQWWKYYSSSYTGRVSFVDSTVYNAQTSVNEYVKYNYILQETVNGCPTYPDTVEITHAQLQNTIDIAVDDDTICLPQAAVFTNNSNMTYFDSIYWEFGDGSVSNLQGSTTYSYTKDTCYDVKITLVNALGCKVDSILEDLICAYKTPIADFIYSPLEPIVPQTDVDFTNLSLYHDNSFWNFAGLGNSTVENPSFHFPHFDGGKYSVTLTVTNEGGCTDNVTKIVVIKNILSIFIPNSFTPNNDGVNDKFRVIFNNKNVLNYKLYIFNRWGEELYNTSDVKFEWDGTFEGQPVPNGIYTWRIVGKDKFFDEAFDKVGQVTIVR